MVVVRSSTMVVLMPWGSTASRNGSCARMRSTVWMMLAPGWRKMMTKTARLPSSIAGGADVLRGVHDIGNIGEADGRAVVIADDQRPILVGAGNLVVGDDVGGDAMPLESWPLRLMRSSAG